MADEMDRDAIAAAELALALLEGRELREAEQRRREDPSFAAEVERWERHFETWFRDWPDAEPPASAREALLRATGTLAANDNPASRWQIATALTGTLAAFALLFSLQQLNRPMVASDDQPRRILAAALTASDGVTKMPAVIELAAHRLRMPNGLDVPRGRSAQLWLVTGKGAPAPIGILRPSADGMSAELLASKAIPAGSVLAISIEPVGGSTTGKPTGPVVASGTLTSI